MSHIQKIGRRNNAAYGQYNQSLCLTSKCVMLWIGTPQQIPLQTTAIITIWGSRLFHLLNQYTFLVEENDKISIQINIKYGFGRNNYTFQSYVKIFLSIHCSLYKWALLLACYIVTPTSNYV